MAASRDSEESVYRAAISGLRRFLGRASELVLAPFKRFSARPDPDAIYTAAPLWQAEVDRIMNALTPALQEGWAAAHLPGDYSPTDPYIQANLAMTKNLLVAIPDEVHALVIRQLFEGSNANETNDQIAVRIQHVLDVTGSDYWEGRARVIANTEANRHYNSSLLAHGLLVEREDGGDWVKEWQTLTDGRERLTPEPGGHRAADHQVRPLAQPFEVGGELLMFPVDPTGAPHNVINCRCGMTMRKIA